MAIEIGHNFPSHTFTGSAGKNMRPTIPGFKRGGEDHHVEGAKDHHGKRSHKDHDGEMNQSKVHYDSDGYQMHKMGGKC